MDQGPFGEQEDRFARVAVVAVLVDGVGCRLAGEGILQLQRHHRDAVDGQHHIQRLLVLATEMELPRDALAVGPVARLQLRIEAMGGAEEGDAQSLAETLEAMA
jgi:hypothetical protein